MEKMDILLELPEETVVAKYEPEEIKSTDYESEKELEENFIKRLTEQGYEYIYIKNEKELEQNLRTQIERLNDFKLSDSEWKEFYNKNIAGKNTDITEKCTKIQEESKQSIKTEKGTNKNINLIDKENINNNHLQVLNQYAENEGTHKTIYDVTILVNGIPMVHIELKRRGVSIKQAFNQIKRYQRDSFWAGCGLYEYVQLFVISNGTHTKYYSNTTRYNYTKDSTEKNTNRRKKTSNSFEFTSFWADAENKAILDLVDFTKTFLAKRTLLNILTKYCVFTSEKQLLVMRPYQIVATERILNKILTTTNNDSLGNDKSGGYIWHTTGSGKTLTSFKTSQLASKLDYVDKVLFVVDRKDLDYQTMKEYDRFEKGSANSNSSTSILQKQLENSNTRIIITTIQKLDKFIKQNKGHNIYKKHIVMIFDECHRSQFGNMHISITKNFKKYNMFGFTGTPIFTVNSGNSKNPMLKTTEQAFGKKLHEYTIVDAIRDNNVLPFRIDYISTMQYSDDMKDKQVENIDRKKAFMDDIRINQIVGYILDNFDKKTYRNYNNSYYEYKTITNINKMALSKNNAVEEKKRNVKVNGFNSIFAVSSIPAAMKYYIEIKKQMEERNKKLNVATIFSFNQNEDDIDDFFIDEDFETDKLDMTSRDFLESAISDYNKMFNVNYDTSSDKFPSYYKDVSLRMKNREIDLLIVVNMFLTGFDATTLNTLWVDKNLKQHGLIQAFSRTNRILNSVKTFGNIVCFRNLEDETNDALALFGDKEAGGVVILKTYQDYLNGYTDDKGNYSKGFLELIKELEKYPQDDEILGEKEQKKFIKLFSLILRVKNILSVFDEFKSDEIIEDRTFQDYQSKYIDLYEKYMDKIDKNKENINQDIVFEIELIKQVEVNIDYILMLVAKYHKSNLKDKEILININKAIDSSIELRSKKQLVESFIKQMNIDTDVHNDWIVFVKENKANELKSIIQDEKLEPEKTKKFINNCFSDGNIKISGTYIDEILPAMSRFKKDGEEDRTKKKNRVINKFLKFFEKYFGIA